MSTLLSQTPSTACGAVEHSLTPQLPPLKHKAKALAASSRLLSSQDLSSLRPKLSNTEMVDLDEATASGSSLQRQKEVFYKFKEYSPLKCCSPLIHPYQVRKAEDSLPDPDIKLNKFKRMKTEPIPSSSSGFYYDGMGGHSKPDIYPSGASSSRPAKASVVGEGSSLKKRGPVKMKIKGKLQTTTLDYFYSQ